MKNRITSLKSFFASPYSKIAIVIAIILTIIWYMISAEMRWGERAKAAGNKVLAEISEYQNINGGTPISLSEIGIEETNGLTEAEEYTMRYERAADGSFALLVMVDESRHLIYSSATGEWVTCE